MKIKIRHFDYITFFKDYKPRFKIFVEKRNQKNHSFSVPVDCPGKLDSSGHEPFKRKEDKTMKNYLKQRIIKENLLSF